MLLIKIKFVKMNLKQIVISILASIVYVVSNANILEAEKKNKAYPTPEEVLAIAEKVFQWQQNHPTNKNQIAWEYGAYWSGVSDIYHVDNQIKYLEAMMACGNKYDWKLRPRPYDANVYAVGHMYIDMYKITKSPELIDNLAYNLRSNTMRYPNKPDVTFKGNKYWWSWWSWCDSLFMAPPTFAKYAEATNNPKYLKLMDKLWKITHDYLYDSEEHLYFRDDRFFTKKSPKGKKVFWSRGNGWVVGGLSKVLQSMPKDYENRKFYENLFVEMNSKLKEIQQKKGYWSTSLLDETEYPGVETSGTAFFCYSLAYGVNSGLLPRKEYEGTIMKAWELLVNSVQKNGKFGYVQQVGDAPGNTKLEDSEAYGAGAFLSAASEVYKLVGGK